MFFDGCSIASRLSEMKLYVGSFISEPCRREPRLASLCFSLLVASIMLAAHGMKGTTPQMFLQTRAEHKQVA